MDRNSVEGNSDYVPATPLQWPNAAFLKFLACTGWLQPLSLDLGLARRLARGLCKLVQAPCRSGDGLGKCVIVKSTTLGAQSGHSRNTSGWGSLLDQPSELSDFCVRAQTGSANRHSGGDVRIHLQ